MNRAAVGEIEARNRRLVLFDRKLSGLHLVIDLFGNHREHFVHWPEKRGENGLEVNFCD